jgi:hypothetical protein
LGSLARIKPRPMLGGSTKRMGWIASHAQTIGGDYVIHLVGQPGFIAPHTASTPPSSR